MNTELAPWGAHPDMGRPSQDKHRRSGLCSGRQHSAGQHSVLPTSGGPSLRTQNQSGHSASSEARQPNAVCCVPGEPRV